jgi:hypothetical protein
MLRSFINLSEKGDRCLQAILESDTESETESETESQEEVHE